MSFAKDSTWICQFPISLAVEGEGCYERMARAGIGRLLFNTVIYAPYRLILPRYPHKGLYSMEEGLYHYFPEPDRYADLPVSPQPARDWGKRDMLGEAVKGAARAGVKPGVWLTVFANGKIARDHPDWAMRNLFDSADRLFLDFNHPEVREFAIRVCVEMAERYDISEIMLDKIPQANLEMDALGGMRIDPVLRILGSFCFSEHAVAEAKRSGIDLEDCRRKALSLAADSLSIPPHIINAQKAELRGDTEAPLLLLDNPWIMELLRRRHDCILSFLGELRERLDKVRKDISLSVCFVPPVQAGHDAMQPRAWLAVQSYAAYKNAPINRIHSVIHWDEDPLEYDTRRAVASLAGGKVQLATHIRAYGSTRPDQLVRLTDAVRRAGSQGLAYFCYDIMSEEMLDVAGRLGDG